MESTGVTLANAQLLIKWARSGSGPRTPLTLIADTKRGNRYAGLPTGRVPTLQRVFANPQRKRCLGGGYEFGIECVLHFCFVTGTRPVKVGQTFPRIAVVRVRLEPPA
jgi:hypothetical protein